MNILQFYILSNSISVISGCLEGDNEILCAMEASVWVERSSLPAINLLSCQGSCEICKSYEYHLPEGKIK